jgi:predicted Zn-dependent peptidase
MNYEIKTLPNGLRIIAAPMKERLSVSIGIWVNVGGRDESPKLSGVSHFLEHIVFKGTATRSANDIKESVEGVGGSFNAFTSEECTCFLAKVASRHFENVFDVLADMTLNASMKPDDVEKERQVIIEEIKMTQDQPSHYVEEILAEEMWPGHALGRALTGTIETVTALTREEIVGYRDTHYHPGLITVVASGDVDMKRLVAAAEKRFGPARSAVRSPLGLYRHAPAPPHCRLVPKDTEQTHLALGMHAFGKEHPDEFPLEILSVLLGGNMSSRLFNEVREERGLAYDIGCSVRKYHETGAFVVSAGVDNHKAIEAVEVILCELKRTAREPVGEAELRRSKEFYLGQMDLGLENSMNTMLWAGESVMSLGRVRAPQEVAAAVEKVTAEDLRRVAETIFKTEALTLAVVGPSRGSLERDLAKHLSFENA